MPPSGGTSDHWHAPEVQGESASAILGRGGVPVVTYPEHSAPLSSARPLYATLTLAALMAVLAAVAYYGTAALSQRDQGYEAALAEQRLTAEAIGRYAAQAARGDTGVSDALSAARERFAARLAALRSGEPGDGLPPLPLELSPRLAAVEAAWRQTEGAVAKVLALLPSVADTYATLSRFEGFVAETLLKSDELVNVMVETGASPEQVYAATRQLMLLERLAHNLRRALTGGAGAAQAGEHFDRDVMHFRQVTQALLGGDEKLGIEPVADSEARGLLEELLGTVVGDPVRRQSAVDGGGALARLQQAAVATVKSADTLGKSVLELSDAYRSWAGRRLVSPALASAFAGVGLLFTVLGVFLAARLSKGRTLPEEALALPVPAGTEGREADLQEDRRRSQAAILRLLDETNRLADGELDVTVTVTHELTEGLAKAINRLADRMRQFTAQVSATAGRVRLSAGATRVAAQALLGAVKREVPVLDDAAVAGQHLESALGTVLPAAQEGRLLAGQAAEAAGTGRSQVQATAHAVDATREALQDAAKRLKRVGEGCQTTGDLVALMDDVAEQSNILALNAAIQAAVTSSERGFSVVADEVQRLSEQFADASRRMGPLVKGMQSGTREAMASVEGVTTRVLEAARAVEGALRAIEALQVTLDRWAATTGHLVKALETEQGHGQAVARALPVARSLGKRAAAAAQDTLNRMTALRAAADALSGVAVSPGAAGQGARPPTAGAREAEPGGDGTPAQPGKGGEPAASGVPMHSAS
jgi:twitching motility protein PilJ